MTTTSLLNAAPMAARLLAVVIVLLFTAIGGSAHPLGNFTINHFARIEAGQTRVRIRYVIDMAEIPTFQVTQGMQKNVDGTIATEALNDYLKQLASQYVRRLVINEDGRRVELQTSTTTISMRHGLGGLPTLRVECDIEGDLSESRVGIRTFHFEDTNDQDRAGWHEIVVVPASYSNIFNSTAYGSQVTDELKTYPSDTLAVPLNERTAEFSWTAGSLPSGADALRTRDGKTAGVSRDPFVALINVQALTPLGAMLGLLLAAGFGALHALSPGHGKTLVAAYLVGSKGTPRHAFFLGLTVTITHTAGVFALGLVTLFASQYILPERIFPILSFISGAIVLVIGLTLFVRRLGGSSHEHRDARANADHSHHHIGLAPVTHTHGGGEHSHIPPGADGTRVTWRSLLALGISGGLLPCPSAFVVLLSAIALRRVGYGLLLVIAFSAGLAATLTSIGLLFVLAGRLVKQRSISKGRFVRLIPALSALLMAGIGGVICHEAITQSGLQLFGFQSIWKALTLPGGAEELSSIGAVAVLGLGFVFGLKHATEVDHVVAVSTIVSEHRNILHSALVGGLWGLGHTASLILAGFVVIVFRVAIPNVLSNWLELSVAGMIVILGLVAFMRALGRRDDLHFHKHGHGSSPHTHTHFHESVHKHSCQVEVSKLETSTIHDHSASQIGFKPLVVGMIHGLAGSGALTVLVLTQINSAVLGLTYLAVFGIGSIVGMLFMSLMVGLPFVLAARRLNGISYGLQASAGALSIAFGLWYAYETGVASGLLGRVL